MDKETWHLDKKVPISLLIGLLAQSGLFIWWASGINSRVEALEAANSTEVKEQGIITEQSNAVNIRLSNIETRFTYLETNLNEVKTDVRTLLDESRN